MRSALLDCALLDLAAGMPKLAEAVVLDPALFAPPAGELCNWILEFSGELWAHDGPKHVKSRALVDRFWTMLPKLSRRDLAGSRQVMKGRLFARDFYAAHASKNRPALRGSAWRALLFDPSWAGNLGFWSIWLEALLGERLAQSARANLAWLFRRRSKKCEAPNRGAN